MVIRVSSMGLKLHPNMNIKTEADTSNDLIYSFLFNHLRKSIKRK